MLSSGFVLLNYVEYWDDDQFCQHPRFFLNHFLGGNTIGMSGITKSTYHVFWDIYTFDLKDLDWGIFHFEGLVGFTQVWEATRKSLRYEERTLILGVLWSQSYVRTQKRSKTFSYHKWQACVWFLSVRIPMEEDRDRPQWEGLEGKQRGKAEKICEVCGAPSLGHNFGAVSCESCKAFFRRNAFRLQVVCASEKQSCVW